MGAFDDKKLKFVRANSAEQSGHWFFYFESTAPAKFVAMASGDMARTPLAKPHNELAEDHDADQEHHEN